MPMSSRDFKRALYIFQQIDTVMLPEQYQVRLREMMATGEMQPQSIQLTKYENVKGTPITVTEPSGQGPAENASDDILAKQKIFEQVRFQALRQHGLDARKTADELFKNKQRDKAIEALQSYLEEVNTAQIDKEKANLLRRPIDNRIQQYKTLMAQDTLDKIARDGARPLFHDEAARNAKIKAHQEEVLKMMQEVNELLKANKLKEAQALAKKVREIDPENPAAMAAQWIAQMRENQEAWDNGVRKNNDTHVKWLNNQLVNKALDIDSPIDFDKARHHEKGSGAIRLDSLDPKERAIQNRLMQPLPLHLKNVPLQQAIHDIAIQSGVQVIPDMQALQRERINLDSPLSISVENIDMKSALNILLNPLKLTYIIEDQVLKITTEEKTHGRLVRIVYPVADLVVPVEDHPLPAELDILKTFEKVSGPPPNLPGFPAPSPYTYNAGDTASSYSSGLGGAFQTTLPGQTARPTTAPPPPSYVPKNKKDEMGLVLVDLIKNVIAKDKWADVGGQGDIVYTPFGLALIVNQVLDVQKDIQDLLESLRRLQDLQVAVELRAVLVSETFFERIGVDFNMNFITPTSTGKQALLQGNLQTASANNTVTGYTQAGTFTPDLNIPVLNNTFNFTQPQFGGYQPGAGLSLGLAFLSDIQVFMFLEAVSGDQRAHVMQAPKLTVYNGQTAFITGQAIRPFVTGVTPIMAPNGQIVMQPQVNQYPFGLSMQVTPVVSPDRRFVRLNIRPTLTNQGFLDPTAQSTIVIPQALALGAGGIPPTFINGAPQPFTAPTPVSLQVQLQQVTSNLTIVQTTVNVPDGGTVLLGGFKFLAEQRTEYGPPVLSNIPYLSRLFRNVGWSRDSSTLLYLVTARIIMVEEEEGIFLGQIPPIPR